MKHIPVLQSTVLDLLDPKEGDTVLDVTVGLGGHALAFLDRILRSGSGQVGQKGKLIGIDADEENVRISNEKMRKCANVQLIHANFRDIAHLGLSPCDVIFADLGLSSSHLDDPSRGFSFRGEGPLDCRYDRTRGKTAADILNEENEKTLREIFQEYGELPKVFTLRLKRPELVEGRLKEKGALPFEALKSPQALEESESRVCGTSRTGIPLGGAHSSTALRVTMSLPASADESDGSNGQGQARGLAPACLTLVHTILRRRKVQPIATTQDLVRIVEEVYGWRAKSFLPQVFQALRIAVNDELASLQALLEAGPDFLKPGGRMGIISYHSLEDRMVKKKFQELTTSEKHPLTGAPLTHPPFQLLTRKPLRPTLQEIERNPRARSARLRALVKRAPSAFPP